MSKETNITIKTSLDAADMFRRQAKEKERSLGEHFENIVRREEPYRLDNILIMREDENTEPRKLIVKGDLVYELKFRDFVEAALAHDQKFGINIEAGVDDFSYSCKIIKSIKGHYIVYQEVIGSSNGGEIVLWRSRAEIADNFNHIDQILGRRVYAQEVNEIACRILDPISEDDFFA